MARDFTFTMQRIYNRPLAITPERAAFILAVMRDRFAIQRIQDDYGRMLDRPAMERMVGGADSFQQRGYNSGQPLTRANPNVAVIEVDGILVKKNGINPDCGMTGYDGIEQQVRAALDNDSVKAIWFDVNSGGGEVSGCFGLCDFIFQNRASNGGKLMIAMAADDAYSAAYAIASSADIVAVPPSGGVGSIGVLVVHVDESKALEQEGITATIIRSGKHKADFNSIEPLTQEVRDRVQAEVDATRDQFVDLVSRNRGLSTRAIYDTEALTYMGADARAIGLVNEVISEQDMFARLVETIS